MKQRILPTDRQNNLFQVNTFKRDIVQKLEYYTLRL